MAESRTIPVRRSDAGELPLHVWTPELGHGPGMVLIQEIFGVTDYVRDVAARLTSAGYVVAVPELFWRFAPGYEAATDQAGLDDALQRAGELDPEAAVADCAAAWEALGSLGEVDGVPGVLGFCLGGTLAWSVAADHEVAVCVSYYGSGVPGMAGRVPDVHCPALLHFGRDDPYIPIDGVEELRRAIGEHPAIVVNLEDAGHAFDNHAREMFWNERAASSAWTKTMAFLGEHLPVG